MSDDRRDDRPEDRPDERRDGRPDDRSGYDLLSAYLDGELDPAEAGAVGSRIDTSPDWREELDAVARARRAVRSLPVVDAPPDVWAAILETVDAADEETAAPTPSRWARRWVAVAAAVVALVLGTAAVVPRSHQVRPDVTAVAVHHAAQAADVGDPVGALTPLGTFTPPRRTAR